MPKLKDSINGTDELCSVIFSAAFSLLITFTYIAFFSLCYLILYNLLIPVVDHHLLLIPAYFLTLLVLGQSIIAFVASIKANHDKKNLQLLNFRLVRLSYIILLGPFNKAILQIIMIFGSNYKKKKGLVQLMILFLVCGFGLGLFQSSKTNIFYLIKPTVSTKDKKISPHYYRSENNTLNFLLQPEVESPKVESRAVNFFIPVFHH